jgi:glycosyltransferase involved in cell wall biosynthesis
LTRSCQRPTELQRCINSVLNQSDPNFEHIIISDEIVHGLYWANRQIKEQAHKLQGQYVYILDDDDYITNLDFIKDFKVLIENIDTDVIICKGTLNEEIFPKIWKSPLPPVRGKIAAPNLITRRKIFDEFAHHWDQPRAGDFHFIKAIDNAGCKFFWWDYDVFCAESSCGFTEKQKQEFGFYG